MGDAEDPPEKTKRTRKMSDEMLEKLAKAREKAAEVRKQKRELKDKEAALKRIEDEKHAAEVEEKYHAATRSQPEEPLPNTSAIAPVHVEEGPIKALVKEPIPDPIVPTIVEDTVVEDAPEPAPPPPVKMKVKKKRAKPPRKAPEPPAQEPDLDIEQHEEPINKSSDIMPHNEPERNFDALSRVLPRPRGAPMHTPMRQVMQPQLQRQNSLRRPFAPVPPPQQQMDDDELDAYHHEYETRMHRVRSQVAYNSMFPTHALEQQLRGHSQPQYPRFGRY